MVRKRGKQGEEMQKTEMVILSERMSVFSLESWEIRRSAVFGARRKAALSAEGFAWVPNLRSLDKLLEVRFSLYLGFTLYLSIFQCFG